ncbi:neuropeptide FF receptor 2-like [Oculina patagonica]
MSDVADVPLTTVLSILVVVNIFGNTLVCLIIKRNRDMRIPMNYLLFNLAIADIIYATFIAPKLFFKLSFAHHPDGMTGTVLCKLLTDGAIAWIGGACSIVTLVVVAIERYYAVMYPHGNKWKLTKANLKVIIPCIWVLALILNIPALLYTDIEKTKSGNVCKYIYPNSWMGKLTSVTWQVVAFLSLALMAVLYSRVVYTLWFKRNNDNQQTHQQKGVMRVRKRVTMMVFAVTVIFGICWGTTSTIYVLMLAASISFGPVPIAITNTMVLFNSAFNPFVYALFNHQFREKMKGMICCTGSAAHGVHPTPELLDMELAANTTHPTHTAACASE